MLVLMLFALLNVDVITSGRILSLLSTVPVFSALISRSSSIWTSSIKLFNFIGLTLALEERSFSGTVAFATDDDDDDVVVDNGVALFFPFAIGFVTLMVASVVVDVPFSVGFGRFFSGHAGVWLSKLAGFAGVSGFVLTTTLADFSSIWGGDAVVAVTVAVIVDVVVVAGDRLSFSIVLISTSGTFSLNFDS